MVNKHTDLCTCAQALILAEIGHSMHEIMTITNLAWFTIYWYKFMAWKWGYDPTISHILKDEYLVNDSKSERPFVLIEKQKKNLVMSVKKNRNNWEKNAQCIAFEHDVFKFTVLQVLHAVNLHKSKLITKLNLTAFMKKAQLQFALWHQHWTLKDWKNVIWTNKTSILLKHHRKTLKVWRTSEKQFAPDCTRLHWNEVSKFMFWGSFLYDRKGSFHCWKKKTAKKKKAATEFLEHWNKKLKPAAKQKWELTNKMRQLQMNWTNSDKKPQ